MTIRLPEDLAGWIQAQVLNGQFASADDLVAAAVRDYLRRKQGQTRPEPATGSIGAMHDDAELLDEVTQLIMLGRQTRTLRLPPDESCSGNRETPVLPRPGRRSEDQPEAPASPWMDRTGIPSLARRAGRRFVPAGVIGQAQA